MDVKDRGSNLVPGRGGPLNLDQLRKLSAAPSSALAAPEAGLAAKPRRLRREGRAWTVALTLGAAMAALGALALLDRGGLLPTVQRDARPAPPDQGLSAAEREAYWALAAREPGRFPALLGVSDEDMAFREMNAHRLERLLSERAMPGRE